MKIKNSVLRWFGLIWILVIAVLIPLLKPNWYTWGNTYAYSIAGLIAILILVFPRGLLPLFVLQTKIATIIGNIISKVVLFLLFYFIVFPIGLLLKVFGKDLLSKKMKTNADSYWVNRENQPGNLLNQF
jgi:fumarate reductase subunit D